MNEGEPLLGIDALVEDLESTPDVRVCTGVGRYRSISKHITFTAKWRDEQQKAVSLDAHNTTDDEAVSRARSLRIKLHPSGDGTFSVKILPAVCTDPAFVRQAQEELRLGISVDEALYREPGYTIFKMTSNGYGSGIMANCIATIGDSELRGEIFLGTNWARGEAGRRFVFYALPAGPEDFRLTDRLWQLSTE